METKFDYYFILSFFSETNMQLLYLCTVSGYFGIKISCNNFIYTLCLTIWLKQSIKPYS